MAKDLSDCMRIAMQQKDFLMMHVYAYRGREDGRDSFIVMPPGYPTPSGYEHLGTIRPTGEVNLKIPTRVYNNGQPCYHPGCKAHFSHPCEVCGRTAMQGIALLETTGKFI